jgi:O-antigen ligase
MTSLNNNPWSPETSVRAPHSSAALLKFLPFLFVGVIGSIVGGWLVLNRGMDLGLVCLALLLALPVTWASWVGSKEVWRVIGAFRSHLKWWHWIWLLSISSSFVFRYRSASEITQNPFDALAGLRVAPEVIVGCILLFRLVFRKPDWGPSMFRGIVGSTAIFGLVCLTSSLWSVKFSWTLYKSLEYLLDLSIVAVVLVVVTNSEEYKTFIDWTWIIAGATLAWVWIGLPVWYQLTWGEDSRLAGAYPIVSSNELGETGAILILVAAIRMWPLAGECKHRAFYILTAMLGAVTMVAAETRSAFAGLAVAALVVLFLSGRTRYAIWGSFLAVPTVIFTSVGPKIMAYLQRDQSQAELMSMSSRLDWWAIGYNMFMQHPLTGLGAYAGSRFAVLSVVGAPQLHSDWLEVLVGTSIWGMIPFVTSLVWIWMILITYFRRRRLEPIDRQLTIEMIGVMTVITIHSFVNVEMTWHHPTLFLIILGWAEFLRRKLNRPTVPVQQTQFRQELKSPANRQWTVARR